MFEVLCTVLNEEYSIGETADFEDVCNNSMFIENRYVPAFIREQIIKYLYLLGKNKKRRVFVKFSSITGKIKILRKIEDFKLKSYK